MNYTLECLEKFENLPQAVKDVFGGDQAYKIVKELEKRFSVDLAFVLILLAIEELFLEDVPEYLKLKFKLTPEKASLITKEIEDRIINPANNIILENKRVKEAGAMEVEETILSVFSENFLKIFSLPAKDIRNFNIITFASFNKNDMLEDKVVDLFYKNPELISNELIELEGRQVKASIANFLKDFIKIHGSDMPDNLVLANYLNNSNNVKKLKPQEKNNLNNVLKTYRNLVFFPESMEGVPLEFWELLPVKGNYKVSDVLDDSEINNNDLINKVEKPVKEEVLKDLKSSSFEELNKMLSDYKTGSLEYKAIKQEISRLQKNNKNKIN
jgi:hypothetical protein